MEKNNTEYKNLSEVPPQTKLNALKEILPRIESEGDLIITGSLALKISELEVEGKVSLSPSDMVSINDLDIATTTMHTKEIKRDTKNITKRTGFPVEVSPIFQNCAYLSSGVRDLSVASIQMGISLEEHDRDYKVEYTTPEFLLLSLVDQKVTDRTPAEKYRRKILAIQSHPKFSKGNFEKLVLTELAARYAMNADTFNIWRRMVIEDPGRSNLEEEFEKVGSLVDQVRFFNAVKSPRDLRGLDYSEIRRIPQLEHFLKEMVEEEV